MKKEVFRNQFAALDYDHQQRCFYVTHFLESENHTEETFKSMTFEILKHTSHYQPLYYLDNATEFQFAIGLELQTWVVKTLMPTWIGFGLQKYAQVYPKEFIARLSFEQTVEEGNIFSNLIQTQIFDNFEDAHKWLLEV